MATLFPALLVVLGRRVFGPLIPRHGVRPTARRSIRPRLGRGVARRPPVVWIGTSLALGAVGIETALDDAHTAVGEPDSVARLSAIKAAIHAVPNAHALVGGPTATGARSSRWWSASYWARPRAHESALLTGLTATGGVITGAGAVLVAGRAFRWPTRRRPKTAHPREDPVA